MTYRIHLTGIVQGVGFRPHVYMLATSHGLCGTVSNSSAGVEIIFNARSEQEALDFYRAVIERAPSKSRITHHQFSLEEDQRFDTFSIIESQPDQDSTVLISPDFALCESCREELKNPNNRRFHYSFITCTHCGPRYSIVRKLPYDRAMTTMRRFDQCEECGKEYMDPLDIRFFSQTNSCSSCGVKMSLLLPSEVISGTRSILLQIHHLLKRGKTVAVKGIGGYLLLCDATQAEAIIRLRERKYRPDKPFAVVYPDASILNEEVVMSKGAWKALTGSVAPIVLVPFKANPPSGIQTSLIAPGLNTVGVMLPYAPILELISGDFGKPLIATSANISHSPIIYDDHEAMNSLFRVADAILVHNRGIVVPQDDSVVRFTRHDRQIIIRRSRGMAPNYFSSLTFPEGDVLAMGAQMKSTITLLHQSNIFVSQYIGDLESADCEKNFRTVMEHLLRITGAHPKLILTDFHPEYASTETGVRMAQVFNAKIGQVQHHKAHFAAVLAENDLLEPGEKVLGVIWDGNGLGDDGCNWGSEFFVKEGKQVDRVAHLTYFPYLLGDKMAREPRLSAMAVVGPGQWGLLTSRFSGQEWKLYTTVLKSERMKTSSMGRLFDAVASLCGYCNKSSYEGEGALLLEEGASRLFRRDPDFFEPYPIEFTNQNLDTIALSGEIILDLRAGAEPENVAARFHCSLIMWIRHVANMQQVGSLAFSGGVFQNALLTGLVEQHLGEEYKLYFHQQLSPNDESISLGQLAWWRMTEEMEVLSNDLTETHEEHSMAH